MNDKKHLGLIGLELIFLKNILMKKLFKLRRILEIIKHLSILLPLILTIVTLCHQDRTRLGVTQNALMENNERIQHQSALVVNDAW